MNIPPIKIDSFNRTFMELKCIDTESVKEMVKSFNRTFMELKWVIEKGLAVCVPF